MALPENKMLGEREFKIDTSVEDGTVFFIYCTSCKKTLYCALENTEITRRVAQNTRREHGGSFHPPHHLIRFNKQDGKID